jgi:hypothetical protein
MLVFLDIDGVMIPAKGWKIPDFLEDGFPAFSSKACFVLQHLITADTTIILTTSHKSNYTIDEWKDIFMKRGVKIGKINTLNDNLSHTSRKDEILYWFNTNKINEDFIIIDDDKTLNSLPPFLKKNLLLTSPFIGLTEAHLKDIEVILQKEVQVA